MLDYYDYDENEMIANAKLILGKVKNLKLTADEEYQPKVTASWSLSMNSTTNDYVNPLDGHLSKVEDANYKLAKISKAINKLSRVDQKLLIDRYFEDEDDYNFNFYNKYHFSRSTYDRKLNQAYFDFALAYDKGKLICYLNKK